MKASQPGYYNVIDFTGSDERRHHYGLLSRDGKCFISHIDSINKEGRSLYQLTAKEVEETEYEWENLGWVTQDVDNWIITKILQILAREAKESEEDGYFNEHVCLHFPASMSAAEMEEREDQIIANDPYWQENQS